MEAEKRGIILKNNKKREGSRTGGYRVVGWTQVEKMGENRNSERLEHPEKDVSGANSAPKKKGEDKT